LTSDRNSWHDKSRVYIFFQRTLCASFYLCSIILFRQGRAKLSKYGLYFMTNQGADVSFPIGLVIIDIHLHCSKYVLSTNTRIMNMYCIVHTVHALVRYTVHTIQNMLIIYYIYIVCSMYWILYLYSVYMYWILDIIHAHVGLLCYA